MPALTAYLLAQASIRKFTKWNSLPELVLPAIAAWCWAAHTEILCVCVISQEAQLQHRLIQHSHKDSDRLRQVLKIFRSQVPPAVCFRGSTQRCPTRHCCCSLAG